MQPALTIMMLRSYRAAMQEVEGATKEQPASKRSRSWYGEVVEYLMELNEGGRRR